jgi:hypothetical protein
MPKRPVITDDVVAEMFADCLRYFAERFYCVGATSPDEYMAACVAWVEGWLVEARAMIAEGTICPSRR